MLSLFVSLIPHSLSNLNMVKNVYTLFTVAGVCTALGIHIFYYLSSTLLTFKSYLIISVRVGADVVIDKPIANQVSGVTQIVSASVVGASAIGVQSDGVTRYVVTEVESFVAVASGSQTSTILSVPTTLTCESLNVVLPVKLSLIAGMQSHWQKVHQCTAHPLRMRLPSRA